MNEGKLYQSQRISFVSNLPKLFTGSGLEDLAVEQIGVFIQDGRTRFKGTTAPTAAKGRKFKIAQGFPDKSPEGFDRAQIPSYSHQTVEFSAAQIRKWTKVAAKPFTKETIVAIGYDGVDATKSLTVEKGKKLTLHLYLNGGPIHQLMNTRKELHREFTIEPDCLGDAEPGTAQACARVQQALIDQIKEFKIHNIPLTRFVKATGISTCDTTPSGLVSFTQYNVAVVDTGSDLALGNVMAQYPGKGVKRLTRAGQISIYQLTQLTSDAAPSDLALTANFPVIPNCAVCPTGYSLQTQGQVFEVTVPSATTVADQSGQLSKTKLSSSAEEDIYQFVMPAATVPATFIASVKGSIPTSELIYIGQQDALCTPSSSAGTLAWTAGTVVNKAPKVYTITLSDTICGTSRLTELQAKFPGTTQDVAGECARRYKQTVYSDPVADGCGQEQYVFTAPEAFQGFVWEPAVSTVTPATGCSCGILLEGARIVRPITESTFLYVGYDKRDFDVVDIKASAFSHDYTGPVCQTTKVPFTKLQDADYPIGHGRDVIDVELDSLSYFGKEYNIHPVIREIYGDKFLAKPDIYYDEYQLLIDTRHKTGAFFDSTGFQILYRFFFPTGTGKEFAAAINTLVASLDSDLDLEVV